MFHRVKKKLLVLKKTTIVFKLCVQHQNENVDHTVFAASCCLRYAKRHLPCKRLTGYTIQTINTSCDLQAIMWVKMVQCLMSGKNAEKSGWKWWHFYSVATAAQRAGQKSGQKSNQSGIWYVSQQSYKDISIKYFKDNVPTPLLVENQLWSAAVNMYVRHLIPKQTHWNEPTGRETFWSEMKCIHVSRLW